MADTTKVQNLDELRASVTRQQGAVRQLKADGADQVRGCLSERGRSMMMLLASARAPQAVQRPPSLSDVWAYSLGLNARERRRALSPSFARSAFTPGPPAPRQAHFLPPAHPLPLFLFPSLFFFFLRRPRSLSAQPTVSAAVLKLQELRKQLDDLSATQEDVNKLKVSPFGGGRSFSAARICIVAPRSTRRRPIAPVAAAGG
jgi:hypothetical protein